MAETKMNIIDLLSFGILNKKSFFKVKKELSLLLKSEHWSSDKLYKLQQKKMQALLKEAQLNVPFWNKIIKSEGKKEKGLSAILEDMPILTKEIIRKQNDKIWSSKVDRYIIATTGGTTGQPLAIRRDYNCDAITKAALWRARKSWGINPSKRTLYLNTFGKGTFLGRLRMRLANKKLGEAFPSSKMDVDIISHQFSDFKPKAVEGFATGLLETVNRSSSKNRINIPVIVSTGEMLYPHQRKILEAHFSGKVFSYYGSNEIGSIAYECEKQQLHICEEHVIVETVDDEGNSVMNKPGRVLVTDLDNIAMPFIRYELGDIAVISNTPCTCGRSSKVISELIGRNQDYLSGIEGQKLQATQLAAYLKDLKTTGQLQFVQDEFDSIVIYFDGNEKEATQELEIIKTHLFNRLGVGVKFYFKNVEVIKKTNRGKQPLVVRQIKN